MHARDLASYLSGRLIGDNVYIRCIAHLYSAQSESLSIVLWPKDIRAAKKTNASCLLIDLPTAAEYASEFPCSLIVVDDLLQAFFALSACLQKGLFHTPIVAPVRSPSARVHQTATVGDVSMGDNTVIGPNAVIFDGARIGSDCRIDPGVVIHSHVTLGNHVTVGAHSVIGSQAFAPYGIKDIQSLPSLGSVHIHNHVQLGAHCTVDRGLIAETRIGENTLIDNMVHLGHDVLIGKHVVIAAQTGVAGYARIGDYVTLGGQVGIAPHAEINDLARISGKSSVRGKIKKGSVWSGNPSVPHAIYLREYARLKLHAKGINSDGTN